MKTHFSAGSVDLEGIDTKNDGAIEFSGKQGSVLREPDAVKWLDDNRLVVANEGDYEGGSRGFTIFDGTGKVLYESGASLRTRRRPYRPLSGKPRQSKGVEPEGLEVAKFGDDKYFFVLAERASVVAVYKDTGAEPETRPDRCRRAFRRKARSPSRPAICLPPPTRSISARMAWPRSHVMIYERAEGEKAYPQIVSDRRRMAIRSAGLPFRALAAVPGKPGMLYAVSDSVLGAQPAIYTIDATQEAGVITDKPRRQA